MIYKCIKIDLPLVVYTFGQCQFNMIDVHNSIKGSYMSAHFLLKNLGKRDQL